MRPAHLGKNVVIVLALVAAGFVAAWLRFRPYLEGGAWSDGERTFELSTDSGLRYAVWDAVEPFAPFSSGARDAGERARPAISSDGRWLVCVLGLEGENQDLYVSELVDGAPSAPRALDELNTSADECAPAFVGERLYFASDRAGALGGLDVFAADHFEGTFGDVEHFGAPLNGARDDRDVASSSAEHELVFASDRAGADFDLYVARAEQGSWRVERLDSLSTASNELEPALTADRRSLFFASDRDDPSYDLYRAGRGADGWSAPARLVGLSSDAIERAPLPLEDDFTLLFARAERSGDVIGGMDLFQAHSRELFHVPAAPVGWLELAILAALLLLALLAALAKRWPSLDTIYKCYLISLIVHLLLLWWFRGVMMEGGEIKGPREGDTFRVRVLRSEPLTDARLAERGGELARADRASASAELERARVELEAQADSERPAVELELARPTLDEASAPARRASSLDPMLAAVEPVDLRDAGAIERRGGAAPELALQSSSLVARRSPASFEPARATSDRPEPRGEAPSLAHTAAMPGRSVETVQRGESSLEPPSATSGAPGVAVAVPSESLERRGEGSAAFSIDAIDVGPPTSGARAAVADLERSPSRVDGVGDATESSRPVAIAAPPRDVAAERAARAPTSHDAPAARAPSIELRVDEPVIARRAAAAQGSSSTDLLDSLAELAPKRAPTREDATPERFTSECEPSDQAAPAPIAIAAVEDRPREREVAPPKREWDHTPYQNRSGVEKARALELHGGSRETEQAVERGLAYLARIQRRHGGWGDVERWDDKYGRVVVGRTALAMLAFLGAGHTQRSNTAYSRNVAEAIDFLLERQHADTGHFGDTEAYSHGIATYALAECFALTQDARLREPLERAVEQILRHQSTHDDPRLFGGWSYFYPDERVFDRWPRTSVTAWQVMALESARLGGLEVPDEAFGAAREFLRNAKQRDQGWYRYSHDPERLRSSWPTLPASTPAALFALSLLGEDLGGSAFAASRRFVLERAPREYRRGSDDEFVELAQGNLYFWYYGTLAMFRVGGDGWKRWNASLKDTLLAGQARDGSWPPIDIYASQYAGDDASDRTYTTALAVLSLEIYYRYYLPLLQVR